MQQQFATEQEAIDAAEMLARRIDCPLSDSDNRILRGVRRSGSTLTLEMLQHTAESLNALIAELRWQREIGGVEVMPGVIFPTTRDVRADLSAELADAELIGATYANTYVIGDIRIPVTLETLRAVNATVRAHVREAFAWQAALLARLDAGEDPNTIAADITG